LTLVLFLLSSVLFAKGKIEFVLNYEPGLAP